MNAAVGLMDGLGLDGDRCIHMIPRHSTQLLLLRPQVVNVLLSIILPKGRGYYQFGKV